MIPFSDEKLSKYFSNELSQDEMKGIEEWSSESSENQIELDQLKSSFESINSSSFVPKAAPKPDWEAFEAKFISENIKEEKKTNFNRYFLVAASLLIAIYSIFLNKGPEINLIETQLGETKLVSLPDGSTVRLNYNSKLEYGSFENERTVKLSGEGFFDIKTDKSKPFTIETNVARTTVLGTKFNLKSRESGTELVVTEGKVSFESLKDNSKSRILIKDQKCDILVDGSISEVIKINSTLNVSWLKKRLIFKNESFKDVINELERVYNKKIKSDESISSLKVSAVLHYEKPLKDILSQLCASFNLSFSEENDHFLIK